MLIIGGGVAGLTAAVAAKAMGIAVRGFDTSGVRKYGLESRTLLTLYKTFWLKFCFALQ